eukprot:g744.t1
MEELPCRLHGCDNPRVHGHYGFCSQECRTARRRRGAVPGNAEAATAAAADDDMANGIDLLVSNTLVRVGGDITIAQYHGFCRYIAEEAEQGVASYESGDREQRMHVQSFSVHRIFGDRRTAISALLRRARHFAGITGQAGYKLQIKPFTPTQSVSMMIGYCYKDRKNPQFRAFNWNISNEEVRQGITDYMTCCDSYTRGRSVLHKSTVVRQLLAFLSARLPHLKPVPDLAQLARWALQLGTHTFSEEFIKCGNQLMSAKSYAFQRAVTAPEKATVQDVRAVMYLDADKVGTRSAPAYANVPPCPPEEGEPAMLLPGGDADNPDDYVADPRTVKHCEDYDTMSYEQALNRNLECRADEDELSDAARTLGTGENDPLFDTPTANVTYADNTTAIPNTEQDEQEQSQAEFCADGTAMNNALFGVAPTPGNAAQATQTVHSGSEQSDLPTAIPQHTANNGTTSNMAQAAVVGRGRRTAGRRCAICGQTGHNRRTCPALRGEEEEGCSENSSEVSSEDEYGELEESSAENEGSTDDEEQEDGSSTGGEEEDDEDDETSSSSSEEESPNAVNRLVLRKRKRK